MTRRLLSLALLLLVVGLFGYGLFMASNRAAEYLAPPALPTPTRVVQVVEVDSRVSIVSAEAEASVVRITIEAVQFGGDLLFDPPVLRVGQQELAATPDSLKGVRIQLLEAITAGRAQATLAFADVPAGASGGVLIFNPASYPGSNVNPQISLAVNWSKEN